ncbi:MAG: pantoate--beta-alanine ligase [Planctomycetota bacterium]|nr:MAG: pantoate--beta-alanine ligase [Planctomycetota bacterium]
METLRSIAECRQWRLDNNQATVVLVPTMGALHAGHLALIRKAQEEGDAVMVSIFVNPIQFDDPSDFDDYPLTLDEDLITCAQAGVAAVFVPQREEIYPNGYCTFTEVVGPLTDKLCGGARPGHFRGVATVVLKLLNIIQPQVAVFGEKDLQQVLIIQRMVADLHLPVRLSVGPTVREADGLPLSSRNARLSQESRAKAAALPRGLDKANAAFRDGQSLSMSLVELVYEELLVHPGVEVDYADVVRLADFSEASTAQAGDLLAVAAFVDGVRLIDHILLGGPGLSPSKEG